MHHSSTVEGSGTNSTPDSGIHVYWANSAHFNKCWRTGSLWPSSVFFDTTSLTTSSLLSACLYTLLLFAGTLQLEEKFHSRRDHHVLFICRHLVSTCRTKEYCKQSMRVTSPEGLPCQWASWFNFLNSTTWKKMCSRICLASC